MLPIGDDPPQADVAVGESLPDIGATEEEGASAPPLDGAVPDDQRGDLSPPHAGGTRKKQRWRNGPAGAPQFGGTTDRGRRQARPQAGERRATYAALDLGTNNCRLLVAVPRARGFRVVDGFSRIVRLGEGVGSNGQLSEAAMARSIAALRVCNAKLIENEVGSARLIATEACRAADNGLEFVARVREETGLRLEIVPRQVEARLAVAGCASLVDQSGEGVLLFDIGGGSSELVWIDLTKAGNNGRSRRMADRIRAWQSLPVGVVNLSERHGGHEVTPAVFEAMVAEVNDHLNAFPEGEALSQAVARGRVHMLGTSGTVTTLAGVHLELPRYDRRRVDGVWLSGQEVSELTGRVVSMDFEARVADPCIGKDRADLVISGCAILEAFRRRWPCDRLRVADRGLREGVLVELMAKDGVWRSRKRGPNRKNSDG